MVAKLVDVGPLAALGRARDLLCGAVQEGHATACPRETISGTSYSDVDIPHDARQRILLAPDFDVGVRLRQRAAAVELRGMVDGILYAVEGLRDADPAALIDNPVIRQVAARDRISVIRRITVPWYCASVFSITPRATS